MKPIIATDQPRPALNELIITPVLVLLTMTIGVVVGLTTVAIGVAGVLVLLAVLKLLFAPRAYVDYARACVAVWGWGLSRLKWKRIPLSEFQRVEVREEVVNVLNSESPSGAPEPSVSEDPQLVAFIDLIGPLRIRIAEVEVIGCDEKARAIAQRTGLPLRLSNGSDEPVQAFHQPRTVV